MVLRAGRESTKLDRRTRRYFSRWVSDEAGLWKYLSRVMGNLWEAQRHEDKYSTGIPDVSYATSHHGWIELKSVAVKDENRVVKVPHFTAAQKAWAKRHGARCGKVWTLIRVNRHHLLFGWWSVDRVGNMTLPEMIVESHGWWEGQIDPRLLIIALDKPRDHHSAQPKHDPAGVPSAGSSIGSRRRSSPQSAQTHFPDDPSLALQCSA